MPQHDPRRYERSERTRFEEESARLAVTGPQRVRNRRHGYGLFTADLLEARRQGPAMSLLILDIGHFKAVYYTYGHQDGDQVLMELCRRLTANLRASDALARCGGEEFVIVMRHCTLAAAPCWFGLPE